MARAKVPITVIDTSGNAVVGASVNITKRSDASAATLYSAETGAGTVANPATTDAQGRVQAWLLGPERYNAAISGGGISTYTEAFEALGPAAPQIKRGTAGGAFSAGFTGATTMTDGAGSPANIALSVTPDVPSMWIVRCQTIVKTTTAVWNILEMLLTLNTADVDGITAYNAATEHNSAAAGYTDAHCEAMFRLAAGTAYTVTASLNPGGGTWQYHQDDNYLRLLGHLVPIGS